MPTMIYSKAFLVVAVTLGVGLGSAAAKDCGFPGQPQNGSTLSSEKFFYPGEEVTFECDTGFILFGKKRRTCVEDGSWSDSLPECRYNMALKRTTSQSETLWSYDPDLAVDGDPNTCSFTPQSEVQRWWKVHLIGTPPIGAVAVTISPGTFQQFTIFVVELMDGNKAMYKPCAKFEGKFQDQKALFNCNDNEGHTGQFVYIRDDRKDKEYFGLCEVEVFEHKGIPQCGQPEQPIYGTVKLQGDLAHYTCIPGYTMRGNASRQCTWKGWHGKVPDCTEVQCDHPESTKDGFIEVSNFKGSYVYGSRATYHCNPGFILWGKLKQSSFVTIADSCLWGINHFCASTGNATRLCDAQGLWTGSTPKCQPIACGDPITFQHVTVALINGSTIWRAVAQYACIHGYRSADGNSSLRTSHCLQNGTWTPVHLTCVPEAHLGDGFHGTSADGGFLVGGGAHANYGSGTMMVVAVIAAVITGVAVAFFIIFVRKWLLKWSDSTSNHHLFMGSGPGGGLGGPNGGPPSSLDVSFKGVGGYSASNQYSTMPMLKQDKLDGTNIYQTTTLSTFGRGSGAGGGAHARGIPVPGVTLPTSKSAALNQPGFQNELMGLNGGSPTNSANPHHLRRPRRLRRLRPNLTHRKSLPQSRLDGLTTATSLSSSSAPSTPESPCSISSRRGSNPGSEEEHESDDTNLKHLSHGQSNDGPTFKYADARDIAKATLRKGCLQPERLARVPNPHGGHDYANVQRSAMASAAIDPFANIPYATLSRKSSNFLLAGGVQNYNSTQGNKSNSSIMNYFDPLKGTMVSTDEQHGGQYPYHLEDGQIILLPPSDSIPDILQTASATNKAEKGRHALSLTRSGNLPKEVMALYAKGDLAKCGGTDPSKPPPAPKKSLIVNELSNLWHPTESSDMERWKTGNKMSFSSSMDDPLPPSVPKESYISAVNSNIDQNI
ncbi:uncharacterized protein LOC131885361 isoform X1 [Tigriopus californicus]|uniref:uncharacterized protein LOC131885361 isoform X1 n=1 Tax=Tigriopus californicus TaxID=6832 RepID=UPI0027D9D8AF|nr:uncharacterized protein LOC131885361 isoform X1 [Tigriopus californicus]